MTTQTIKNENQVEPIILKDDGPQEITIAFKKKDIEDQNLPEETFTLSDFVLKKEFTKKYDLVSEVQFEWIFKTRDKNGFKDAFKQVGRKFFVHIPTFYTCLLNR
jgi:hypothetical protein